MVAFCPKMVERVERKLCRACVFIAELAVLGWSTSLQDRGRHWGPKNRWGWGMMEMTGRWEH